MPPDLFAGLPVSDHDAATAHYDRIFGPAAFSPHGKETVWEVAPERYVYAHEEPEAAGGGRATVFVADLDATLAEIRERGLEPTWTETYSNGVRKAIFRDSDGNEVGFGGGPADAG